MEQAATCHRHRAQLNSEVAHNSADCSGIGGHSCARHGCFAPGSLVNFQKGERQMNMDWSLCEALATTNIGSIRHVLHIYDINCEYWKKLLERIERNDMLSIADHIVLIHAIGLFHIHGHKNDCLYRWATNYVPGAGVVDGEVLETLWSVLNTVSAATRTASLAHRTEILDDHMNDSNWKKMLHIGNKIVGWWPLNIDNTLTVQAIIKRYNRALENLAEARSAFERLNESAPADYVDVWDTTIVEAESARNLNPSAMDVMQSKIKTGRTLKAITADILREETQAQRYSTETGSSTDWILEGLKIEDEQ